MGRWFSAERIRVLKSGRWGKIGGRNLSFWMERDNKYVSTMQSVHYSVFSYRSTCAWRIPLNPGMWPSHNSRLRYTLSRNGVDDKVMILRLSWVLGMGLRDRANYKSNNHSVWLIIPLNILLYVVTKHRISAALQRKVEHSTFLV